MNGACARFLRSIPAWAGETREDGSFVRRLRVYPRVGGGNQVKAWGRRWLLGLSPRGRGKPTTAIRPRLAVGSIPAWAGETR